MRYTEDHRWVGWADWFETAWADVSTLAYNRLIWRNLAAMLQANNAIEHHSMINGWLTRAYAQMQAVGVRRQWEFRDRRPTIGRLLDELRRFPEVASRGRFYDRLPADELGLRQDGWLQFSPNGAEMIDVGMVAADHARLNEQTRAVRNWVNEAVAHNDPDRVTGPVQGADWFGDINRGLDVLLEMVKKYYPLFHPGEALASVTPHTDLNWVTMFQVPWHSDAFRPVNPLELG